jgi:hypothetical protein
MRYRASILRDNFFRRTLHNHGKKQKWKFGHSRSASTFRNSDLQNFFESKIVHARGALMRFWMAQRLAASLKAYRAFFERVFI